MDRLVGQVYYILQQMSIHIISRNQQLSIETGIPSAKSTQLRGSTMDIKAEATLTTFTHAYFILLHIYNLQSVHTKLFSHCKSFFIMYFSYLIGPPPPHPCANQPGPLGGGSNTCFITGHGRTKCIIRQLYDIHYNRNKWIFKHKHLVILVLHEKRGNESSKFKRRIYMMHSA